jgi:maltooligosyltrehalose trehalohydrolase
MSLTLACGLGVAWRELAPRYAALVATPWGGAVAVDEPPVARFFIDNALMWLRDYRLDGLRFDAVHAIDNPAFLDAMAAEIRAALPDRHVHLVLENEHNDAARLHAGAYDAQWNDDFHNVLHVLLTGETSAYYADFADRPAERLALAAAVLLVAGWDLPKGVKPSIVPADNPITAAKVASSNRWA